MMRAAMKAIDAHSAHTVMVGERMDTDVVAGLEAGLPRRSSSSAASPPRARSTRYPYRPSRVVGSVADLIDELGAAG